MFVDPTGASFEWMTQMIDCKLPEIEKDHEQKVNLRFRKVLNIIILASHAGRSSQVSQSIKM